jgi:ABC-2 type transport system ATP-binding protein
VAFVVADGLRKRFRTKERLGLFKSRNKVVEALAGVSFEVGKGRLFSLVGPNGAGKTTTVKILATLLLPDAGTAMVGGHDIVREAGAVRRITGLMLYPDKGFFGKLSGLENLVYYGMLYGLSKADAERRGKELLELVDLAGAANRPYEEYSMGMKARLALAKALINDPELLLLDEPTVGIDPLGARKIRELISGLKREGKTIIFTSHNLWEVEELSDEVALIMGGRLLAVGPPGEIKARFGFKPRVVAVVRCSGDFPYGYLEDGKYVINVDTDRPAQLLAKIVEEAENRGCEVAEASIREPSLEEVVVKIWRGTSARGETAT